MTTLQNSAVPVEPGWLWRGWWVWTEPSRLVLRLFSEQVLRRRRWLRLSVSFGRIVAHLAVGHAWWTSAIALWLFVGIPLLALISIVVAFEIGLLLYRFRTGRPALPSLFRLAVKMHRVWPRVFADTAAKSERIQDREAGGLGEARAPVVRSVVDHPRLPWRFWAHWPVITFRVGVAPGRSFAQLERVMAQMSANIPWVHAVELEYRTDRSSFGLLHVALHDVLAETQEPSWTDGLQLVDGGKNDEEAA